MQTQPRRGNVSGAMVWCWSGFLHNYCLNRYCGACAISFVGTGVFDQLLNQPCTYTMSHLLRPWPPTFALKPVLTSQALKHAIS
jgi:hypothetical protein